METNTVLFEISKPPVDPKDLPENNQEADASAGRFVRYHFTPEFLRSVWIFPPFFKPEVNALTLLGWGRWEPPLNSRLARKKSKNSEWLSAIFSATRCSSLSTLTLVSAFRSPRTGTDTSRHVWTCLILIHFSCEHIYDFPSLDPETIRQMIASPFETKSDSFYFVDNKLVMHNKADYSYNSTSGN